MKIRSLLAAASGAVTVSDVSLVFVVIDSGLAYFLLSADQKPVLATAIGFGGLALGALSILPISQRLGDGALLGAALVLGAGFNLAFLVGHPAHAPFHDSVLLTDAAAQGLIAGHDPYGHDYLHTFARRFYTPDVPVNFGLGHYVYTPVNILLDIPLRLLARVGGPDLGFQYMYPLALAGLALVCFLMGHGIVRRVSMTAVALNPLLISDSSINFFNDVFFLGPAIGSAAAIRCQRPMLAGVLFGLALATKQQAVLLAPVLLLGIGMTLGRAALIRSLAAAVAAAGVVLAPFLVWSPSSFAGDVAGFFYGSGVGVYPIRGASLPGLLLAAGLLPNRWVPFPSAVFQIAVSLPALAICLLWLCRSWTWPAAWLTVALFSSLVFFFGRVLSPNYIDTALLFLTFALLEAIGAGGFGRPAGTPPAQVG